MAQKPIIRITEFEVPHSKFEEARKTKSVTFRGKIICTSEDDTIVTDSADYKLSYSKEGFNIEVKRVIVA
jgi:hypothetical protein